MPDPMLPPARSEPRGVRLAGDGSVIDIPADEAIRAARERNRPLIICARRGVDAEDFRNEHNLLRRRTIYATQQSVRGWSDCEIVVLPGFHDRPDAEAIWAAMVPGMVVGRQTYLVTDEHGEPLGTFDPDLISEEGTRFAFSLAEVCHDPAELQRVQQAVLTRVGSATFGYVAASALHVMAETILAGAFAVAKAHGTDLQAGMAAIARGEHPS